MAGNQRAKRDLAKDRKTGKGAPVTAERVMSTYGNKKLAQAQELGSQARLFNDRRRQGSYNPLSDPESAYNNPNKGPHASGAPGGGIPLRGDLSEEQAAWMKKGRPSK